MSPEDDHLLFYEIEIEMLQHKFQTTFALTDISVYVFVDHDLNWIKVMATHIMTMERKIEEPT